MAEKGQEEAHTGDLDAGAFGDVDLAVQLDALRRRLGSPDAGAEQLDLLDGSADGASHDTLSLTANIVAARRRGAGRPQGSANKRNTAVFELLEALGHRDPAVTLSMIQTADTKQLARALSADPLDVLRIQAKAAADLMPYKYARKVDLGVAPAGAGRPVMIIGEMNVSIGGDDGFLSAAEKPNEINGVVVRHEGGTSHDGE